jgi:ribosomal protein L13|tara:strand:- start:223 stop:480 length:258 start_codon:yes stop_codon:yes gene_type:complete
MLKNEDKNSNTGIGYKEFNGQQIPVVKADSVTTWSNKKTQQQYANQEEALADVKNPTTATIKEDIKRDVVIKVSPINLTGILKND